MNFIAGVLLTGIVAWKVRAPRIPWLWYYGVVYAASISFQFIYAPLFAPRLGQHLQLAASQALILMILVPVFAVIMADNLRKIFVFMAILLSFDAVYVLSGGNGVMTGATFDAAVMAVFIATMVVGISAEKRGKLLYLALIPMVGVILTQDGGAAIMALLACGLWNAARLRGLRARLIVLAATVGVALAGYLTQGAGLYSSPGRLRMWAAYMDWWLANASPWFGAGPGSFNWIGPLTFMDEYQYYWMHNDWLQILFEYGIIGLALSLAILVKLLRSKDPRIQTFTVGVAAVMCFYSPLHLIPVQLLICLCILVSN